MNWALYNLYAKERWRSRRSEHNEEVVVLYKDHSTNKTNYALVKEVLVDEIEQVNMRYRFTATAHQYEEEQILVEMQREKISLDGFQIEILEA